MRNAAYAPRRYELKFRPSKITERRVLQVASKIRRKDRVVGRGAYLISSLYLDAPDRTLYQRGLFGYESRYELRGAT